MAGLAGRQFTKADLRMMRDKLIDAGTATAANRTLASLGPVMRWASEEDLIPHNIVPAVRRSAEAKRERVLTKKEIVAIWRACENFGDHEPARNYARMIRFLLVTASGVTSPRHCGMAISSMAPGARPKTRRAGRIACRCRRSPWRWSNAAMRVITYSGPARQARWLFAAERQLDQTSGVHGWRLHDLRRSAASNMQDLEIRNEIVQAVLNHAVPGVGGVYLRSNSKQKAEALATWATALTRIVRQGGGGMSVAKKTGKKTARKKQEATDAGNDHRQGSRCRRAALARSPFSCGFFACLRC